MAMVAPSTTFVVGVDTHRDSHCAVLVDGLGAELSRVEVATTGAGLRQLLEWAREQAPLARAWAVEGTGSYGFRLAELLSASGEMVFEADRPRRPRRRHGKSDAIDAIRAARELLVAERPARPRLGPEHELVRSLLAARELAANSHRIYLCRLKSDLVHLPNHLREQLAPLGTRRLLQVCRHLAPSGVDPEEAHKLRQLRRLAERILEFERDIADDDHQLQVLASRLAPHLLALKGIGPVLTAEFLNAWASTGRIRTEAAFAMLCGAAPIPASSGQTVRHRLNRGGDRRLNRALHQAVLCRLATDAETRDYARRRRAEGKSSKEVQRCLKRYLARRVFRALMVDRP